MGSGHAGTCWYERTFLSARVRPYTVLQRPGHGPYGSVRMRWFPAGRYADPETVANLHSELALRLVNATTE